MMNIEQIGMFNWTTFTHERQLHVTLFTMGCLPGTSSM